MAEEKDQAPLLPNGTLMSGLTVQQEEIHPSHQVEIQELPEELPQEISLLQLIREEPIHPG
jgi:hypothetical protein